MGSESGDWWSAAFMVALIVGYIIWSVWTGGEL